MSDLLQIHLAVGGTIIVCCAIALRFRLVRSVLGRFDFEQEHIAFINAVLWFVIASLLFIILRDLWRNAFA